MGDAGGPARRLALLRAHAGDAERLALRQFLRAVAGKAHGGDQRIAQALRAARVLARAVEHRYAELGRVLADRMGEFVDHAFDSPEGPSRRHRPQLAGRRRRLRHLVEDGAHRLVGHGVEIIRAIHGESVERALLVDRWRQELRDAPAFRRPGADDVVFHRRHRIFVIEAGADFLVGERPREIHRHVILARIDDLDGLADCDRG